MSAFLNRVYPDTTTSLVGIHRLIMCNCLRFLDIDMLR